MTQEEIKTKLKELREERNKLNKEADEVFAKTRPIQAEIDRLEMLTMNFDYEAFGKEPKYVRYEERDDVDNSKTIYLGYITKVQRRTSAVTFYGKIITYQEFDGSEQFLRVMDNDCFDIYKGKFDKLEIISKEKFDLESHLFAAKVLKTTDGNIEFVHEYMVAEEKACEAFNKVLGGFIDSSFDMSKPWEEIFKSYLKE